MKKRGIDFKFCHFEISKMWIYIKIDDKKGLCRGGRSQMIKNEYETNLLSS